MRRISLYQFLTTFAIVPTYDWAAFGQRVLSMVQKMLLFRLILKIGEVLFSFAKTPMYLGLVVAAITYFPDTIAWIFVSIGQIQIKCFMIMLNAVMPDIFATGAGDYRGWADIWSAGLSALPEDVLSIVNGVGVAEIMGLVTTTITSGWMIKIYRKTMLRAGLL